MSSLPIHPDERDKTVTFEGEGNPPGWQIVRVLESIGGGELGSRTPYISNMTLIQQNDRYRLTVTFTRDAYEGQYDGRVLP